jgi:hypothetical protein
VINGLGNPGNQVGSLSRSARLASGPGLQIDTIYILRHQVVWRTVPAVVIKLDNPRVPQPGRRTRLTLKPVHDTRLVELLATEHFQGDLALDIHVVSEVHCAETTGAELTLNAVRTQTLGRRHRQGRDCGIVPGNPGIGKLLQDSQRTGQVRMPLQKLGAIDRTARVERIDGPIQRRGSFFFGRKRFRLNAWGRKAHDAHIVFVRAFRGMLKSAVLLVRSQLEPP